MSLQRIDETLAITARALARDQHAEEGAAHVAGEFPMTLRCPDPRLDYNFLSGYALLHLAITRQFLSSGLPPQLRESIDGRLRLGADVPAAYRTPRGTNNWYHGKCSGDRIPPGFPWPDNLVLSLQDDLDDTAIAALLGSLSPEDRLAGQYSAETFSNYIYSPDRDTLRPSSRDRLAAAAIHGGVYMTWALAPAGNPSEAMNSPPHRLLVPFDNTIEFVTVSNIYAAVHRLGGPVRPEAHRTSARFVNATLCTALAALTGGNPEPMAKTARYYPRVPFAPVGFVLRDHLLSDRTLLEDRSVDLVASAVRDTDPSLGASQDPFAGPLHWLNAAGWCAVSGMLEWRSIRTRALDVLQALAAERLDPILGWPDFVFFHDAHIGHYSGRAYANAVALETLAAVRCAEGGDG